MARDTARILGIVPTRRRALALLLFALVYLVYGWVLLSRPLPGSDIPAHLPGLAFMVTGGIALFSAIMDRPHQEWLGFTALYVWSGLWSLQFLYLLVTGQGQRPWAGLAVWGLVTAIVVLLAGWTEPPPKHVMEAVRAYLAASEAAEKDRDEGA